MRLDESTEGMSIDTQRGGGRLSPRATNIKSQREEREPAQESEKELPMRQR